MRINKYIASCGICSRRKAEELIISGKVKVNGKIETDLSSQIEPNDVVLVNNKVVKLEEQKIYIMLNKPKGYITTNIEQFSRACTKDLINEDIRVFPIGRLDMYTEGLLLFTNDGEFANKLMHPSNKIEKTYIVKYKENVSSEQIKKLQLGVDIGGYVTKPAKAELIGNNKIKIKISEGKNRQVRKMCEATGIELSSLKRTMIGSLELGSLAVGKYKILSKKEINRVFE